jgi:hypothetical protein
VFGNTLALALPRLIFALLAFLFPTASDPVLPVF